MIKRLAQGALALTLLIAPATGLAAGQPKKPMVLPSPNVSKVPLHTDFNVEVNKLGQVVRVKSGKSCKDLSFNAKTYGNVLQMWIRKPDGSAIVGMYHVTYDYDPKTRVIQRHVSLIKPGGNWGNEEGAANNMLDIAKREYLQGLKKQPPDQSSAKNLPDIKGIVKRDVKKAQPTASPTHKP